MTMASAALDRAATHRARRRRNRCAVGGDERARHALVGAHAREVVANPRAPSDANFGLKGILAASSIRNFKIPVLARDQINRTRPRLIAVGLCHADIDGEIGVAGERDRMDERGAQAPVVLRQSIDTYFAI